MSLFDDEFYSTRVSKRTLRDDRSRSFRSRSGGLTGGPIVIAFASSLVSALAAVMLFGFIFGYGGKGTDSGGTVAELPPIQTIDTAERIIQASAKVRPAVVSIINEQRVPGGGFLEEWAEDEEHLPEEEAVLQQASLGSGVIYEKQGGKARLITNYHVVEGAYSIKAMLVTGEIREAVVVGKDQITDLAVLEIDGSGIDTIADIGDSTKLRDGETVIAIGNPLGLGDSLTMGIVSKSKRVIPVSLNQDGNYDWEQEVIQIDASINQGNSGGALVNLNGQVIGINSMKVADYGVEGLGFAIPMHNAMPIVEQLEKLGKVPRPYLGVYTIDLEQYHARPGPPAAEGEEEEDLLQLPVDVKRGVLVLEAVGPAKDAGLTFNDVIVKLDGVDIGSTMELRKYMYMKKNIGEKMEISYYRGGKLKTLSIKLSDRTE